MHALRFNAALGHYDQVLLYWAYLSIFYMLSTLILSSYQLFCMTLFAYHSSHSLSPTLFIYTAKILNQCIWIQIFLFPPFFSKAALISCLGRFRKEGESFFAIACNRSLVFFIFCILQISEFFASSIVITFVALYVYKFHGLT